MIHVFRMTEQVPELTDGAVFTLIVGLSRDGLPFVEFGRKQWTLIQLRWGTREAWRNRSRAISRKAAERQGGE